MNNLHLDGICARAYKEELKTKKIYQVSFASLYEKKIISSYNGKSRTKAEKYFVK